MRNLILFLLALMIGSPSHATLTPGVFPVTKTGGSTPSLQDSSLSQGAYSNGDMCTYNQGLLSCLTPIPTANNLNWGSVPGYANGYVLTGTTGGLATFQPALPYSSNWTLSSNNLYSPPGAQVTVGDTVSTPIDVFTIQTGNSGGETINATTTTNGVDNNTILMLQMNGNLTDSSQSGATFGFHYGTGQTVGFSNIAPEYAGSYYAHLQCYNNDDGSQIYSEVNGPSWANFGYSDFTIDFWFEMPVLPTYQTNGDGYSLFGMSDGTTPNNGYRLILGTDDNINYYIYLQIYSGGSVISAASGTDYIISPAPTPNTWYHLAFIRHGSNFNLYWNGQVFGPTKVSSLPMGTVTGTPFTIGAARIPVTGYDLYRPPNINVQGFRISNIARWTSNFTPPNQPYFAGGTGSPSITLSAGNTTLSQIVASYATHALSISNNGITGLQFDSSGNAYFPQLSTNGIVETENGTGELTVVPSIAQYWSTSSNNLYPSSTSDTVTIGQSTTSFDTLTINGGATGGVTINSAPQSAGIDSNNELMLHLNNNVTDSSQNGLTVTNSNVTFSNTSPAFAGTYYGVFNGTNAILTAPNESYFNPGSGNFTVDFDVNFTTLPTAGNSTYTLFSKLDFSPENGYQFTVFYNSSNNFGMGLQTYSGGSNQVGVFQSSGLSLSTGIWYHVAVVRNGSAWTLYLNGNAIATTTSSATIPTTTGVLSVGAQAFYSEYYLAGSMAEFRFSNSARWTSNFTPPTLPYASNANAFPTLTFATSGSTNASIQVSNSASTVTVTNNGNNALTIGSTGGVTINNCSADAGIASCWATGGIAGYCSGISHACTSCTACGS